jgi:acetylornithine deacetylase/succinyl-diaminopimelate desuccinylase-like protein
MRILTAFLTFALSTLAPAAQTPDQQLARDIFKQLIEINTTDSEGDNTRAAHAMAARFRTAGFPESDVRVLVPSDQPRKGNLVVRLHGKGPGCPNCTLRPVLFIGHLDVVEAKRSDWSFDPFVFREEGGYFYGRGTSDMKGDVAVLISAFLRMRRDGYAPGRDLILALTSDEEGGPGNGVQWLLKEHRDLIDAAFCINSDAGGGHIKNGKRIFMSMEAAEKVFLSFKLETTNPGGHSSLPVKDNAIYHLAGALSRLAKFDFPVHLFDVTKTGFERAAAFHEGEANGQVTADMRAITRNPNDAAAAARLSQSAYYNAQMRTTCVPTLLAGGHAENALPQLATANVNCRLLPVDSPAEVKKWLERVIDDPAVKVTEVRPAQATPYTPLDPFVMSGVTALTTKHWPGLPVIPLMETGATDGIWLIHAGIPTYGVSGIFGDEDDVRAHGKDERTLVQSFYEALDFMHDLVQSLGSGPAANTAH